MRYQRRKEALAKKKKKKKKGGLETLPPHLSVVFNDCEGLEETHEFDVKGV